jgi:hypothetical protein
MVAFTGRGWDVLSLLECYVVWRCVVRLLPVPAERRGPQPFVTFGTTLHQLELHSLLLTNSVAHNPYWEADSRSSGQEIPRPLWNPNFHYRVYKNSLSVRILCKKTAVHIRLLCFLKIHFNIILSAVHLSLDDLVRFSNHSLYTFFIFCMRATCPTRFILLGMMIIILVFW